KNSLAHLLTLCFMLFSITACAQDHRQNILRLNEINDAILHTVLLNNHQQIVPVVGLDRRKIASINLGFKYQMGFDSLLNKYAKVTPLDGLKYADSTTLNDLEDDLKYYNTILVAIDGDLSRMGRNINFIQ